MCRVMDRVVCRVVRMFKLIFSAIRKIWGQQSEQASIIFAYTEACVVIRYMLGV